MSFDKHTTGIQLALVEVGKHYDNNYLHGLATEECAELIQAINKINRHTRGEYQNKEDELQEHLFEEIADVEIMLQVLKNRYRCENAVYNWKLKKVKRWQERLKLAEN